jgi:hypothetical protein
LLLLLHTLLLPYLLALV